MLPIPIICLLLALAVGLYFTGVHFASASKRTASEDTLGILMVIAATVIVITIVVDWGVTLGG